MTLSIEKNKYITRNFIVYLIRVLRRSILANVNLPKLSLWDKYLKEIGVKKSSKQIILWVVTHLKYIEYEDRYTILIEDDRGIGKDKSSYYNLCLLLDKGTLDMKPLRLFSDSMKEIEKNIKQYFDMYCFIPM